MSRNFIIHMDPADFIFSHDVQDQQFATRIRSAQQRALPDAGLAFATHRKLSHSCATCRIDFMVWSKSLGFKFIEGW